MKKIREINATYHAFCNREEVQSYSTAREKNPTTTFSSL